MALGVCAFAGVLTAPMQARAANPLRVETKEGPVRGFLKNGVAEFLGVPYAEPPLGNLRWKPPHKHAPWTNVLQATAYGPTCAQITTLGVFAGPANNNEDCLYLNVFTPNVDPVAREKLPVIFWIHGGGNVDGESNDYDGAKLAAQGHAVVVTINYRLNLMGFLANPALDAEGHNFGNYGTLDQLLALKWVRHNIGQFGGDKNNITVGGQSAGAQDTGVAVISPLFSGLFHRAIYESSVPSAVPTLAIAEARGTAFSVAAGCGAGSDAATAKCLRSLTAQQIETLAGTASTQSAYITGPLQDGTIIPIQPSAAWKSGQFSHMPMMNGRVQDEANFGLGITEYFSGPPRVPPTAAQYTAFVTTTYSGNAGPINTPPAYPPGTVQAVLAHYPVDAYASPQLAWDAVATDPGACITRHYSQIIAPQVPYYAYEFDERTAPYYFPKMPGFQALAYHTSDIQYLFPLYHGGPEGIPHQLNKKQEDLSDQLVAAWTNFAWTGNPNGLGNAPWPAYTAKTPFWLSEDIPFLSTLTDAQFSANHKCGFWDKVLIYP
ncbi:Carboxylic ester hydrolase [Methylocella tundrae]|uniref:Carboxylic ester hydrolase n=1 Tax=Methylocella tundrae TaxID=227605 RepID=A0A8B6M0Y7_METTU|nr:carboxylesterase family protein [Methylocella tundrae]VTZ48697.1 Carboxylic ester hydrolase [Methylocella tundrae]